LPVPPIALKRIGSVKRRSIETAAGKAYQERSLPMFCKFLTNLFRRRPIMATVDFTALNAELDNLAVNIQKVADALGSGSATRIAELEAELATAQADVVAKQADLDAAQSAEADASARANASNAALVALVPAA
jgi:hypothetical protein